MFIYKRCGCKPQKIKNSLPQKSILTLAGRLKLASAPSRLSLLLLLGQKPHCGCDLMVHTKMSQTLISHHLSDLIKAGLAQSQKKGQFVDYSLTQKGKIFTEQLINIAL